MSWFDSSGFAGFAKTALTNAQKKIDKVLDIEEINSSDTKTRPATTSSLASKDSSGQMRAPTGGSAFAAYGTHALPVAPKIPSSINRDAGAESSVSDGAEGENNEWGNQSSLWSSWFDFSGKDQGVSGGIGDDVGDDATKRDDDCGGQNKDATLQGIVAAQPPREKESSEANGDDSSLKFDTVCDNGFKGKSTFEAELVEPSKLRDNQDLKRSGSARGRRSREPMEAKRAKPAQPKKFAQRVGEMKTSDALRDKDAGDSLPDVVAVPAPACKTDDVPLIDEKPNPSLNDISESPDTVVLKSIPTAVKINDDVMLNDIASFQESTTVPLTRFDSSYDDDANSTSLSTSLEGLEKVSMYASVTSVERGSHSLSASACWEVKEGDSEVEAILRKHEAEGVNNSNSKIKHDLIVPSASGNEFQTESCSMDQPDQSSRLGSSSAVTESEVITPESLGVFSSCQIASSPLTKVILTTQPTSSPLAFASSSVDGLSSAVSVSETSLIKSSSASSGLSSTSSAGQTVIPPILDESDLTNSFTLSQPSLSTTKLTDSSTTEGTLGPDEEEERDGDCALETQIFDISDADATASESPQNAASNVDPNPLLSTSVSSIASNVVKDLLGDAMTESLTLSVTPPPKTLEIAGVPEAIAVVNSVKVSVVAGLNDDDSYDDDEDPVGSGKGDYNSSDDIQTASDEREETATSSDIEIISNPSIMDGDVNDQRFEVTSPLRSFGPLPISESAKDVIFHHQSLQHGRGSHQRTPSQSSSCSSSANAEKKRGFVDWKELKVDTRDGAGCESDSPFESPNFGDSENEEKSATLKKKKLESTEFVEIEKSAASVRQRLFEETGGGPSGGAEEASGSGYGAGRRTPRMTRSRKSSERHLSTTTLTSSSDEKRDLGDEDDAMKDLDAADKDAVTRELLRKMKDMSEVIQAREANAFDLSKMNAELTETVSTLRQQLANAVTARDNMSKEMDSVKEEFGRRLAESENKLRATAQDRDAVKRELNQALKDVQSKAALEAIVKEKEDLVQELMDEGSKLSLQLGNANTALKKVRAKEKEGEGVSQRRKEKAEAAEKRVAELEVSLEEAQKREKTKSSRLDQLEEKVNILETIKFEAESQMEDDKAKMESLKVSLEASNLEISSLKTRLIEADSLVAEAEGKAERNATKAIEREFEAAQETLIAEREALAAALEDLRVHASRQERDMSRREDVLKQELSALQLRLQEADERNEQLVESMGGATLPLLRQIENLKLTMSNQAASWEAVEANLNDRLFESQEQLIASEEKERVVSEELFELRGRLTAETSKSSSLSTEKTLLKTELETLRFKLTAAEEAKSAQEIRSRALQTSSVKAALTQEINELKIVKLDLENQVESLGLKVVELERRHRSVSPPASPRRSSTPRPFSPPPPFATQSSTASIGAANSGAIFSHPAPSLYSVVRDSGASFQVEEMQSQFKQKDGEICQLQTDIMNLELTRESMASELVELANKNTALEESLKHYPILKKQHSDMEVQYNALLQMFGEKAEEYDELRMDLEHVKTMYKQQIEELIQKDSFRR